MDKDERFWNNVDRSGGEGACWPWIKARHKRGYGICRHRYGRKAHRVALSLSLGRAIADGLFALHSCDNPPCCNPRHLREGTALENKSDERARGRIAQGERIGTSRYSDEVVRRLRERASEGVSLAVLASEFGVSIGQCSAIARGAQRKEAGGPLRDMAYRRGEETPSSKLTEEKVREIRASQETQVAIALRFGISTKQVRNIKSNRAWKHVK